MTAAELLTTLQSRDVRLTVKGDKLHLDGPRGALTPGLVGLLNQFKPDLIRLLRHADDQPAESDQSAVSTTTAPPDEPWDVWLCRVQQELTGQTWRATTPVALADDDHLGRNPR